MALVVRALAAMLVEPLVALPPQLPVGGRSDTAKVAAQDASCTLRALPYSFP